MGHLRQWWWAQINLCCVCVCGCVSEMWVYKSCPRTDREIPHGESGGGEVTSCPSHGCQSVDVKPLPSLKTYTSSLWMCMCLTFKHVTHVICILVCVLVSRMISIRMIRVDESQVKNPESHCGPCLVWGASVDRIWESWSCLCEHLNFPL